ncbi:DNA cytosine methyltransferase [Fictibacillus sp. NRS-1165]|uniref:DNA cytosine methyltransferase n=1 Tax=Fictibacillus sp. NRS-1165 TaxID=3144463 RepID=UPI003D225AFB
MTTKYKAMHLFCGIGGGSLGFGRSKTEYKGAVGQFENICGIDADPEIVKDYERITGSKGVCMDLFSRDQYIDFHGQEPPEDWREVTGDDIWMAAGCQAPDVVFTSPPCKGFSGLLPEKSAKTSKYQALNKLTVRGIRLCLDAFDHDLPSLFLLENVPRITSRGKKLLDEIKALLISRGYVVSDESHDCGEIGGLAQHRKRYLLIARNEEKMSAFVYKPVEKKLKTIGDVFGPLPLPDDAAAGPLHKMPNLQWKTWVRLALIPAGGDWRDLKDIDWENYRIDHYHGSGYDKVEKRDRTGVTDPKLNDRDSRHPNVYKIEKWDESSPTVTGNRFGSGAPAISDPRVGFKENASSTFYKVTRWEESASTITGAYRPNNGALSIPDPRFGCSMRSGTFGVMDWNEAAKTVTGSGDVHAGCSAIADPRIPEDTDKGVFVIIAEDGTWHRPLTTFELAMLQGFPSHFEDGVPFQLEGKNDARWRERIGNAVPPEAAEAIANVMLYALMVSAAGEWELGFTEIWVTPEEGSEENELSILQ